MVTLPFLGGGRGTRGSPAAGPASPHIHSGSKQAQLEATGSKMSAARAAHQQLGAMACVQAPTTTLSW